MNKIAHIRSGNALIVTLEGQTYTVPSDAPNAIQLQVKLSEANPNIEEIRELLTATAAIKSYSSGRVTFEPNGTVTLDGEVLPQILADRVTQCYDSGVPFDYLVNFFDRLKANPSARAVQELYKFLEHKGMPITPEGKILAYKGVQEDYYSCTGNASTKVLKGTANAAHQIYNGVGEEIIVERRHVDDDARQGCSSGLHAGSLEYATGFGPRTIIVSIDPADVVSIPLDCNCQKMRCCRYTVVDDYQGRLSNSAVRDERNPYTSSLFFQQEDHCPELPVSGFCVCDASSKLTEAYEQGVEDGDYDGENGDPADPDSWGGYGFGPTELAEYRRGYQEAYIAHKRW